MGIPLNTHTVTIYTYTPDITQRTSGALSGDRTARAFVQFSMRTGRTGDLLQEFGRNEQEKLRVLFNPGTNVNVGDVVVIDSKNYKVDTAADRHSIFGRTPMHRETNLTTDTRNIA